jgi:hypothetical protein
MAIRRGPVVLHPQAACERGETQDENREFESECRFRDRPTIRLRERDTKNTPGVYRTQRNLHKHACGGDQPSISHDLQSSCRRVLDTQYFDDGQPRVGAGKCRELSRHAERKALQRKAVSFPIVGSDRVPIFRPRGRYFRVPALMRASM